MDKPGGGLEGYVIDLLDLISKKLSITVETYEVPDGRYGSKVSTSSVGWNGMIGEILKKKVSNIG